MRPRLTYENRKQIEKLLKEGFSCSNIAKRLDKSKNVIVLEVRYGGGKENYIADKAQIESEKRNCRKIYSGQKLPDEKKMYLEKISPVVKAMIEEGKSFFQIKKELKISHPTLLTIYKTLNTSPGNFYTFAEKIESEIFCLKTQIDILFEEMKRIKND